MIIKDLHKILKKQLVKQFGDLENIPSEMIDFVSVINETYFEYDNELDFIHNSLEISSQELSSAFEKQKKDAQEKKITLIKIKEAIQAISNNDKNTNHNTNDEIDNTELLNSLIKLIIDNQKALDEIRKLSQAIEQSPVIVVITDLKGKIEYVNPQFTFVTGYTLDEVFGKNPNILKSNDEYGIDFKDLWYTISSGKIWIGELLNKKKNGELYWEHASISGIKNTKGEITHYISIKEDITNKIIAENELKSAKESAETANKAKSYFLANMSHEIRTPMNSILGFSEVMLNTTEDETHKNYLKTILDSGNTLLALINNILDLSKIEAESMEMNFSLTNLREILDEVKMLFLKVAYDKKLEFTFKIPDNFPQTIYIDEIRIKQILMNLVGNAIKFTEKGFIRVFVEIENISQNKMNFNLSVQDSGIGISDDYKYRIFDSFTQQVGQDNRKYGGTGLGLSITKKLVELLKGSINLESKQGLGTKFIVNFRNIEISNNIITKEDSFVWEKETILFNPAKILVVDDIDYNRLLVKSFIKQYNFEIIEAENGEVAYDLAQEHLPDLILMDIRMPVMSGYESNDLIKSNSLTKHIPVIALTASIMKSETDRILSIFDGFLIKPLQKNTLINELIKFLDFEICIETNNEIKIPEKNINIEANNEYSLEFDNLFNDDLNNKFDYMSFNEIETLANKLIEFTKKNNIKEFELLSEDLEIAINSYDFDKINSIINEFKKYLKI